MAAGSRAKAAALLAAMFILGVLVGAGGMAAAHRIDGPGERGPRGQDVYLKRLTRELELTDRQEDSVRAVLARHRPAMDSLWREVGPRYETLRDRVRSEIRAQLSPDQSRKFAEMSQRLDAMRHHRRPSDASR